MLRYSENLCVALAVSNVGAFLAVWAGAASPGSLKLPLLGGFALFFVLVLVALGQATPLARARRPQLSALDEPEGLSARDLRSLLNLAPRCQRVIGWLGLAALVVAFVVFGGVSWSTGTPFERSHALGIAFYVSALAAILYPLLGALSRLPAALEDRVKFLQRNDA